MNAVCSCKHSNNAGFPAVTGKPVNYSGLIEYVDSLSTEIDLNKKLKRDRLVTLNLDNEPITVCSVYSAIVAQVKLEGKVYVCCDGRWYCLDLGFYTEVMDFVKKIPVSDVDLPNCYPNEAEGDYNLRASEEMDYCLLDKKMFGVKQGPRKVEACDIFTRNVTVQNPLYKHSFTK